MNKIVIFTNHSYMLYQFRKELIEHLIGSFEIVIGLPFGEHIDDFKHMGCKLIDIPINRRGMNPITDYKLLKKYKQILREECPDKVITYSIKPNIYAGLICRMLGIPYYVNVQGLGSAFQSGLMSTIVSLMYKVALKKANVVFFENNANAGVFIDKKIIKSNKVMVLQGAGVNLQKYRYYKYPDDSESIHFLYLGRIMREKGFDELLEAIRNIKKKYQQRVTFDIVGFFEDEYSDIIKSLATDGTISFHGFQKNPIPFYRTAHCVVLPSWHEGMSNVLLEAASTGRALITSDIPGCREAVVESETGYLTEVKNASHLISNIERFISLSSTERRLMGEKGRRLMESKFDKIAVVNDTISAIKNY